MGGCVETPNSERRHDVGTNRTKKLHHPAGHDIGGTSSASASVNVEIFLQKVVPSCGSFPK